MAETRLAEARKETNEIARYRSAIENLARMLTIDQIQSLRTADVRTVLSVCFDWQLGEQVSEDLIEHARPSERGEEA